MQLTSEQVNDYSTQGYLYLPEVFDAREIAVLHRALPALFAEDRPENVREKDGKTARTNFAAHLRSEPYRLLSRHPRLIEPARQLVGGDVYIHQFKLNAKAAFDGDVWQWHQDYGTWARDDLMPEPRALNVALFLDEVTEFNGALMFIPRSHKKGKLEAGHDRRTTSYPLWTLDNATVRDLVADGGLVSPKGPAGSVMFFHCNLVHGSPSNMSPFDRTIAYVSLCHVDNHIRRFKRPDYIAHRDFSAVQCEAGDCLLRLAEGPAAAE